MSIIWVLILIVFSGRDGGSSINYIEFATRPLCEAAAKEITDRRIDNRRYEGLGSGLIATCHQTR